MLPFSRDFPLPVWEHLRTALSGVPIELQKLETSFLTDSSV